MGKHGMHDGVQLYRRCCDVLVSCTSSDHMYSAIRYVNLARMSRKMPHGCVDELTWLIRIVHAKIGERANA